LAHYFGLFGFIKNNEAKIKREIGFSKLFRINLNNNFQFTVVQKNSGKKIFATHYFICKVSVGLYYF